MIKVVLFDIDNTLLDFDQYVKDAMKNGFEKFALGKYDNDTFAVFTKVNSELWHDLEKGKLSFEQLKKCVGIWFLTLLALTLTANTLKNILESFCLTAQLLKKARCTFCNISKANTFLALQVTALMPNKSTD